MLIDFEFENHYCYKDRQSFSMRRQRGIKKEKPSIYEGRFQTEASRVAAIYGANASGKSSILKALLFVHDALVLEDNQVLSAEPFSIGIYNRKKPSKYSISFIANDGNKYKYMLEYAYDGVHLETLHVYQSQKPTMLYERRQNKQIVFGKKFTSKNIKSIILEETSLGKYELLLRKFMKLDEKVTRPAYQFLKDSMKFIGVKERNTQFQEIKKRALKDKDFSRMLNKVLPAIDVGISSAEKVSLPPEIVDTLAKMNPAKIPDKQLFIEQNTRYSFIHEGASANEISLFGDLQESNGTIASTILMATFYDVLKSGGVCIVDEIDTSLHPLLVAKMVSIFNSTFSNPKNAQLVFSTHDIALMENHPEGEILDRDQIWFAEKGRSGCSRIQSLNDRAEAPRSGTNIGMRYLTGRYGAVPDVSLEDAFRSLLDGDI